MYYNFQALFIGLIILFSGQKFRFYYYLLFSRIQEKHIARAEFNVKINKSLFCLQQSDY